MTNNIILLNFDIAEDLRLPKKSKLMAQIGHELFQILSQYPNLTLYLHYWLRCPISAPKKSTQ